ncbi:sodium-translocating pyrophosphatase [Chlorobium sp. BLA1]|uniref:sodium-translocating pyrophosphatase n=1 Tax=Candidatus Chlorobium masyuteum TaxID=2716876 RepID=UPI00141EE967|nr:sodium-translocating pyrophosphatase [Candidatus Chlorobium masyuteum]NHQ60990.1 sodium-translocating pyrophosphatase [Candidatus Chlorobium masyuteum]NTU45548.1 sodium-translocating pyrophosphatase [Chlorobiaceae bacterium]
MKKPLNVTWLARAGSVLGGLGLLLQSQVAHASEADLVLPDLHSVSFLGGIPGDTLLLWGLAICLFGMLFGVVQYMGIRNLPVHSAMKEISELIYATCKTYLITQGKFILVLWVLIGAIIVAYFGWLRNLETIKVLSILAASLIGILGSYTVAWFGMRINTFANSRTAFASLGGKPFPTYAIPLRAGMSIGMLLISIELFVMLCILLFVPNDFAGPCFIGFAIGESLGASVLRIAGGIFTKIADIGSDLMKIVFKIKEDDARNPGVIADCAGDNAGDSVGPTADGFETYGVTGVALISFILLAIKAPEIQIMLLVWIFAMRLVMILASAVSYWVNAAYAKMKYSNADEMNFEKPLITLVWLTSIVSIILTYIASYYLIRTLGDGTMWWKLASIITCGTIAGALIPELVNRFTSTECAHVRNVVQCTKEGGAALNILSGLVAGNFSAYWMGLAIVGLMAGAYGLSTLGLTTLGLTPELIAAQGILTVGLDKVIMLAPSVFAFGLVAFGFLSMGPVTIAVDSYGPVTDNAQSVYELSLIENVSAKEIESEFGFQPDFTNAKRYLEANDGAGNTFKATAKPVLIGTAVVGSTTMIFSIIMILTNGLADVSSIAKLSILSPPFLLGLMMGGAVIYWFTGASINAVTTGAYYAVEFIKQNIKLDSGAEKASIEDSKKVVEICTKFAQKGMLNIFLTVFFTTLAFACLDSFFFIGYLISIALFGLYQAIFMANAGGAWDNAKKLVETELNAKGTELHDASIVGDTVGDPFKDTSSVALNPIIKFTTLFGLLAIELAIELPPQLALTLSAIFFALSLVYVHRSFFSMRIKVDEH